VRGTDIREEFNMKIARIDKRRIVSGSALIGDTVINPKGQQLGKIEEIMVDVKSGMITNAILAVGSFHERLFAVPWEALRVDRRTNRVVLCLDEERLKGISRFIKDRWPDMADQTCEILQM
jgi:sporulation protein YlmC with PRC-barrel domain